MKVACLLMADYSFLFHALIIPFLGPYSMHIRNRVSYQSMTVQGVLCVQANPRQRDSSGAWEHLMRPKRQAPPPPMGRPVSMEQPEEAVGREPPQGAEVRDTL